MKPKSFVNLISTGYQLFVEIIKMLAKFQCHIKMNLMIHHQQNPKHQLYINIDSRSTLNQLLMVAVIVTVTNA